MSQAPRLCCISVDLDEIPNYHAIHGLPPPDCSSAHLVYERALDRLGLLASSYHIPLTLFAIGADLEHPDSTQKLRDLADHGHEISNHSYDHFYDLTHHSPAEIFEQVKKGADAIEKAVGYRPAGFRAPGYVITDTLVKALEQNGARYDSSVFPCPLYYGAKAAAMGLIALQGRRSHSVLDHPHVLLAPRQPYRMGTPYYRRGTGLVELPVQVTPKVRLPYIGTTLTLAGPTKARWLTRMLIGQPLINLELHGIDVLDESDGLQALRTHQPDVPLSLQRKLDTFSEVISLLRRHHYSFVRSDEAAQRWASR